MATKQTETTKKNGKADAPPPVVVGGKQTAIPGTEPNATVPKPVLEAAEALRTAFNAEKSAREKTAAARGHVEMLLVEHNVPSVTIVDDKGDRVVVELDVKRKVKMRVVDEDD